MCAHMCACGGAWVRESEAGEGGLEAASWIDRVCRRKTERVFQDVVGREQEGSMLEREEGSRPAL